MKRITRSLLLVVVIFTSQLLNAQSDSKTFDFTDFDKVQIDNLNGDVTIALGKSFSIEVSGEDNAQKQVQISKSANKLMVQLANKYVTDWRSRKPVKVQIVMPLISKLFNFSNADIKVIHFEGKHFVIENKGNGNLSVAGTTVDHLEISNQGNGNLETKNIIARKAVIAKSGNGDVNLRTDADFNVEMSGNGDIVNYGKGRAIIQKQMGTGKVVYRN